MSVKAINIAMKDFEVSIRTRKFQIIIALFTIISLGMIYSSKRLGISANLYKTPFQMLFLSSFSNAFNYSIASLGILLGATAINEEIEKGTLKLVASKPVYRDEIIAGKLLGGLLTLSVALALFYILTVAFALILGVLITGDDLMKFLATFPFSTLYGLVFLSLGLLVSTLIKKSKNALIMSIFLFVFFGFLLSIIAGVVAFAVAGLPPVPNIPENATNLSDEQLQEIFLKDQAYQAWLTKLTITAEKILYISPNYHYQEIIRILFGGKPQISDIVSALAYEQSVVEERSIVESLGLVWENITALLIMFIFPFAMAYVRFMKADLR
ncbi:ABC transporter permease [Thermococcus barophilus]|uniref:ABC transporter permease n=1 Tax=Thermococcus barophilus TaxID=55802 RepID=UPI001ED8EF02|nr:ABC transporter permease [Thermococcus barophilus]